MKGFFHEETNRESFLSARIIERLAARARSIAEFISRIEGGLQELEESIYWLELLVDSEIIPAKRLEDLRHQAEELTAILVSSVKTEKRRKG